MKKQPASGTEDDMRAEYDLSALGKGIAGKYYDRSSSATNLVLIEPDLALLFPDSDSVNRALRLLAETARAATKSEA